VASVVAAVLATFVILGWIVLPARARRR